MIKGTFLKPCPRCLYTVEIDFRLTLVFFFLSVDDIFFYEAVVLKRSVAKCGAKNRRKMLRLLNWYVVETRVWQSIGTVW